MRNILQPCVQLYKTNKSAAVEKDHGRIYYKEVGFSLINACLRPTTGFQMGIWQEDGGIEPTRIVELVSD